MARTNYYVDPAINANSGTGSIGDPFGDLQYGLNTVTRDSTNGDQFNVKAGTNETLAAALTLATYGTPTEAAPLAIRGYTSSANDGGIGVISGGGSVALIDNTGGIFTQVALIDMRLTNTGSVVAPINLGASCTVIRCRIDTNSRNGPTSTNSSTWIGCQFDTFTGGASGPAISGHFYFCTFSNFVGQAISTASLPAVIYGCIFDATGAVTARPITVNNDFAFISHNTIRGNANTVAAISAGSGSGNTRAIVTNNLIVGYSGVGGIGITSADDVAFIGHNAFYNNSTNVSLTGDVYFDLTAQDIQLLADPFVNGAAGDLRLTDTAISALRGQRFPETYPGFSSMVDLGVMGAWQTSPGASSGVVRRVARILGG